MECWACAAPGAEYLCGRCRRARFCGPPCQRAAWGRHRGECQAGVGGAGGAEEAPEESPRPEVPPWAAHGVAEDAVQAAAHARRRPCQLSVYPNVGVLQGDVKLRLEQDTTFEAFCETVGSMVLDGAAGSSVRLFSTEGGEITTMDDLERNAGQGVVASDGPEFRRARSTSEALAAAIRQPRRYDASLVDRQAPRIRGDDPELPRLLRCHVPVIVEASGVGERARDLWGFDYLARHLAGTDSLCVLQADPEAANRFMYYSLKEADNPCGYSVRRTTERRPMAFSDFQREAAKAEERRASGQPAPYLYLQTALLQRAPAAGSAQPVNGFGASWGRRLHKDVAEGCGLGRLRELAGGRELGSCQLFCGGAGGYTPMHFDSEDNLFLQVRGWKRILLFHPKYFDCLYPFPVHHPQDRSSRVDLGDPDLGLFPRFASLRGRALEAHVGPGELLHVPPCWWHQVEMLASPPGGECVSLNFWYAPPSWYRGDPATGTVAWDSPLTGCRRVLFLRYLEQLVAQIAGPQSVREVLEACRRGRRLEGRLCKAAEAVLESVRTVCPGEAAGAAVYRELLEGRFEGLG